MKYQHLLLLLLLVAGCTHKENHFRYTNRKHYDSLLVATTQEEFKNDPDFKRNKELFTPDTAQVKREVWDSSLGIVMRMHSFMNNFCDIIYVGGSDGFEMAFPFFKEWLYDPAILKYRVAKRASTNLRLNEYLFSITNRLNLKKPEDLVRFSRLFAGLLGLKELTVKDTNLLTAIIRRQYHFDSTGIYVYAGGEVIGSQLSGYTDSLVMRMKMIRADLLVNNPDLFYYYIPYVESSVLWQFTVKANGEMNHMEATTIDGDFYTL